MCFKTGIHIWCIYVCVCVCSWLDFGLGCMVVGFLFVSVTHSHVPHQHQSTLLQQKLHWLPMSNHIKCKAACMCFNAITGSALSYLSDRLHLCTLRNLHWSSDPRLLRIQQYKHKTHGFCSFSHFGPCIWNSLPHDLRHCSNSSIILIIKSQNLPFLAVLFWNKSLILFLVYQWLTPVCVCVHVHACDVSIFWMQKCAEFVMNFDCLQYGKLYIYDY